jgi:phosphatidylserine/phosphatidylglycerophosphate/cardiolipin synthase-like enzyme
VELESAVWPHGRRARPGSARQSAAAPLLIEPPRNAWRETTVEDSGVIVDAADYYRAFVRAARGARRYILMSGWQFDSTLRLLPAARGKDRHLRLLPFLNGLCAANRDLRIYLLCWDFHVVFVFEREWMQRLVFGWLASPQIRFQFDDGPLPGSSHHQKFVVIDGTLAFVGGIDICASRWDDRAHRAWNPVRRGRGRRRTKPYHDVQAYLAGGDAPAALAELFVERWQAAAGDTPALAPVTARPHRPEPALPLGPGRVTLGRTDPHPAAPVREIEALVVDGIQAARRLIYIETQYFSSRCVYETLVRRMRAPGQPRLDIVILVNERAEALKEEIAVGLRQAKILEGLRQVAASTGHALGLYHARCAGGPHPFRATYLHSKILIVDDRVLTLGSANLTNRSLGADRELNVSWEAAAGDRRRQRAIRRLRVSLLAELGGITEGSGVRALVRPEGLVERLDRLAASPDARLRQHGAPTPAQRVAMDLIDPDDLPFDPGFENHGGDEPAEEPARRLLPTILGRLRSVAGRAFPAGGAWRPGVVRR